MIDFRYHLVSLVSVFLALAVGIALGAGPLRPEISDRLQSQVKQLAADNKVLDEQNRSALSSIRNRDAFTEAVATTLVTGQLQGRGVVVITLPGTDGDAAKALTQVLQTAGATVSGRVDLKEGWTAAERSDTRRRLAEQWRTALNGSSAVGSRISAALLQPLADGTPTSAPTGSPAAGAARSGTPNASSSGTRTAASSSSPAPVVTPTLLPSDEQLDAVLARAVLTTSVAAAGRHDATAQSILDSLSREDLLSVSGDVASRAIEAVILVPSVEQATVSGANATPTASPEPDVSPLWRQLAITLDRSSEGIVVVGPASSATSGGVVEAVRADGEVARSVSTVDTGGTPMGDVTTVFALREQLTGAAGAYGFGKGAGAPLPALGGTS